MELVANNSLLVSGVLYPPGSHVPKEDFSDGALRAVISTGIVREVPASELDQWVTAQPEKVAATTDVPQQVGADESIGEDTEEELPDGVQPYKKKTVAKK